jgi:hypothetical protein
MATSNRFRPRAESPNSKRDNFFRVPESDDVGEDDDSDNTYSLVQDSVRDRKMTQVARIDRMFGDSANEDDVHNHQRHQSNNNDKRPNVGSSLGNKFGSVSSNSTTSSSVRGGSLASLYQARKEHMMRQLWNKSRLNFKLKLRL